MSENLRGILFLIHTVCQELFVYGCDNVSVY